MYNYGRNVYSKILFILKFNPVFYVCEIISDGKKPFNAHINTINRQRLKSLRYCGFLHDDGKKEFFMKTARTVAYRTY